MAFGSTIEMRRRACRLLASPKLWLWVIGLASIGLVQVLCIGVAARHPFFQYLAQRSESIGNCGSPAFSPNGKQLAFGSDLDGHIYLWNGPNVALTQLTSGSDRDIEPIYSPDGKSIYFSRISQGSQEIWSVPATGGTPRQLTTCGQHAQVCGISSDGAILSAFVYDKRGMAFGGTFNCLWVNSPQQLIPCWGVALLVPNTHLVLYFADSEDVWTLDMDSEVRTRICDGYVYGVSPDGSQFIVGDYSSRSTDDEMQLSLCTFAGVRTILPFRAISARFTADGKYLVFQSAFARDVFAYEIATGKSRRIASLAGYKCMANFGTAAPGQFLFRQTSHPTEASPTYVWILDTNTWTVPYQGYLDWGLGTAPTVSTVSN